MPEGDTVFRTAHSMGRALVGKLITGFRSNYPLLTRFHDDTPITGRTVDSVESRGKWLLIHLSGEATLVTHMAVDERFMASLSGRRTVAQTGTGYANRAGEPGLPGCCI